MGGRNESDWLIFPGWFTGISLQIFYLIFIFPTGCPKKVTEFSTEITLEIFVLRKTSLDIFAKLNHVVI